MFQHLLLKNLQQINNSNLKIIKQSKRLLKKKN